MAASSESFPRELNTTVQSLAGLPPREQERVIDAILRDLRPHVQRWSVRLCQRNGDVYYAHGDDAVSESLIAVWNALRSIAAGKREVTNAYGYLYGVAVYAVGAYFKSAAVTGLSGQVSLFRTQRRFSFLSEQITHAEQRPATASEIAAAFNQRIQAVRTNPKKDRVVTEAEVRTWMAERDGTTVRFHTRSNLAA